MAARSRPDKRRRHIHDYAREVNLTSEEWMAALDWLTAVGRIGTDHLDTDVVFGVKDELVVSFIEHRAGPGPDGRQVDEPFLVANYDFVLQALSSGQQ